MPNETATEKLIPAATILLTRDGPDGLEVFMVVRHHQIDFASGALVFPGGKVDKRDMDPQVRDFVDGSEGLSERELGMRVAAIREAFEEAGVLLAREVGREEILPAARVAQLEPYRQRLNDGDLGILEFLQTEGLRLAADHLIPFAHWITPDMMPKRFDTHFYIAAAPLDHVAIHDGSESVDSVWIHPTTALEEAEAGTKTVIFPTRMNIWKLGQSTTLEEALVAAQTAEVVTVLPVVEKRESGAVLKIPAEAGYCVTEEPLEKVM